MILNEKNAVKLSDVNKLKKSRRDEILELFSQIRTSLIFANSVCSGENLETSLKMKIGEDEEKFENLQCLAEETGLIVEYLPCEPNATHQIVVYKFFPEAQKNYAMLR